MLKKIQYLLISLFSDNFYLFYRSTRPFSSASSIRSHNSNKTTSNESVSISKYGNTGSKSAPSICSRVKTNNILSSKKPDIKIENNKRWSALSQPKKPAVSKEQVSYLLILYNKRLRDKILVFRLNPHQSLQRHCIIIITITTIIMKVKFMED